MEIEFKYGHLADYASFGKNRKLNLMGVFENIFVKELPTKFPNFSCVLRFIVKGGQGSKRKFMMSLVDPDGLGVGEPIIGEYNFEKETEDIKFIANFINIDFSKEGEYRIITEIDKEYIGTIPLNVVKK